MVLGYEERNGAFLFGRQFDKLCNIIGIWRLEVEKFERRLVKDHSLCWMLVFSGSMGIHKFEIGEIIVACSTRTVTTYRNLKFLSG